MHHGERWLEHPARRALLVGVLLFGVVGALSACASRLQPSGASPSADALCLSATVWTGAYAVAAFGEAAERAMARTLVRNGSAVAASCTPDALALAYRMRFDAQSLTWRADLEVTDLQGGVVWRSSRGDAVSRQGAFQYTVEHNAEVLLSEFLATR